MKPKKKPLSSKIGKKIPRKKSSITRKFTNPNLKGKSGFKSKKKSGLILPKKKKKEGAAGELSDATKKNKASIAQYQQELDRANRIQFGLLPDKIPKVPGFDIRVHYQSSKEVGGDYYDFIPVSPEHLGIVIADVSGKGVPAAMVMAMTRAALRLLARKNTSAKKTVQRVNKFLAMDIRGIMFVTLIYMILNIRTRELRICNAGHNPLLLKGKSALKIINPPGMAVGLDLGDRFNEMIEEEVITVEEGDRILAYTDGVSEAMSVDEEEFGEEPLVDIIQAHYQESSQKFLNTLIGNLAEHVGEAEQHDDITILTFRYQKKDKD